MNLIDRFRGLFRTIDRNAVPAAVVRDAFQVQPAASPVMRDNAALWYAMYTNHPPWVSCDVVPLGLPAAIGRELSRHALTEFSVEAAGSQRAEFLNRQLQRAVRNFGVELELGLCLGGLALKPFVSQGQVLVESFSSGFVPTRFDGTGKAVGGVF